MTFLAPLGLLLLGLVPLIVLLHLLRERRRRTTVSSLVLWRGLQQRSLGAQRRRLPLTWVLVAQLLTVILLALALSRPQLPALAGTPEHTIIVLDTSASMAAGDTVPSRFAKARAEARGVIEQLRSGDTVTLIRMGPHAERLGSAGASGRGALLTELDALEPGGIGSDLAGALALAGAAVDTSRHSHIMIFTDAAFSTAEFGALPPALAPITWRLIGTPAANDAIVALNSAALPDGTVDVFARVAHYDGRSGSREVELLVDGRRVDRRQVAFQPDSSVSLSWNVPAGAGSVQLRLGGNDALEVDDEAALSLAAPAPRVVLVVAGTQAGGDALERALRAQPGLTVTRILPADYTYQAADLTVFESMLPSHWPAAGGILVVSPPADAEREMPLRVEGTAQVRDVQIDPADRLLRGVDLSGIRFGSMTRIASDPDLVPVAMAGADPLILRGGGALPLLVFAFDATSGNLAERVAFPLLVTNAVEELTPPPLPAVVPAGTALGLGPLDASAVTVTGPDGEPRAVVTSPLALRDSLMPGLYTLAVARPGGDARIDHFAVQSGSPRESDLRPRSLVSLSVKGRPPVATVRTPQDLWPWLAGVALLVLAVEGWLHWRR